MIPNEKILMSSELKRVSRDLYISWVFFKYSCAKFHHCRICVTDIRDGAFLPPPLPSVRSPKKAYREKG